MKKKVYSVFWLWGTFCLYINVYALVSTAPDAGRRKHPEDQDEGKHKSNEEKYEPRSMSKTTKSEVTVRRPI